MGSEIENGRVRGKLGRIPTAFGSPGDTAPWNRPAGRMRHLRQIRADFDVFFGPWRRARSEIRAPGKTGHRK